MEEPSNSPDRKITQHGATKPTPPLTERLRRKPGKVRIKEWRGGENIYILHIIHYIL